MNKGSFLHYLHTYMYLFIRQDTIEIISKKTVSVYDNKFLTLVQILRDYRLDLYKFNLNTHTH